MNSCFWYQHNYPLHFRNNNNYKTEERNSSCSRRVLPDSNSYRSIKLIAPFIFLHGEENSIPAHFSSKKSAQDELIKQRAPSSLLLPSFYPVDLLFPRDPRSIYNLPRRTFCASPRSRFKNQRVHALDAFARSDRISYDVIQCSKRSTFSQWHDKSPSNARFILSVNLLGTAMRAEL